MNDNVALVTGETKLESPVGSDSKLSQPNFARKNSRPVSGISFKKPTLVRPQTGKPRHGRMLSSASTLSKEGSQRLYNRTALSPKIAEVGYQPTEPSALEHRPLILRAVEENLDEPEIITRNQ